MANTCASLGCLVTIAHNGPRIREGNLIDKESKAVIDDVIKILNSGHEEFIHAMKLNIKAYLHRISEEQILNKLERDVFYLKVEAQKQGYDIQGLNIVRV